MTTDDPLHDMRGLRGAMTDEELKEHVTSLVGYPGENATEEREILFLKRAVVITIRRMKEHAAGPCEKGSFWGEGCDWFAREQWVLAVLWRALRDRGVQDPSAIRP